MARNPYDNRRSTAVVTVNSSFILKEFKRNISKGFYGDKELERLSRKIILELWRRDPALLEDIAKLTAMKYGNYLKKEYGTVNFRKKLVDEYNNRQVQRIKSQNEAMMKQLTEDIAEIDTSTMFDDLDKI